MPIPEMHVIWHHVKHDRISDAKEIVGIMTTGWEDAEAIVDKLNADDPDKGFSWRRNYWKESFPVLTLATLDA